MLHYKTNSISSFLASKTFKNAFYRRDIKRRSLLIVKWAVSNKINPLHHAAVSHVKARDDTFGQHAEAVTMPDSHHLPTLRQLSSGYFPPKYTIATIPATKQ